MGHAAGKPDSQVQSFPDPRRPTLLHSQEIHPLCVRRHIVWGALLGAGLASVGRDLVEGWEPASEWWAELGQFSRRRSGNF